MSVHRRVIEHTQWNSRGFTLIELLVVIAIIGLLASTVIASLGGARVKARDTRRKQDITTIRTALELYASDNGHYPNSNGAWASFDAPAYIGTDIVNPNATDLTTALQPFLRQPPTDPTPGVGDDGYLYISNSADYCILLHRAAEDMRNYEPYMRQMSRCGTMNADGQCTGTNSVYIGTGAYASGC